jgi:hypothetical protein
MSTTAVIGLMILAWSLLAIPLALLVGRMIRLRRQRSHRTVPRALAEGQPGDGAESLYAPPGWQLRNKT